MTNHHFKSGPTPGEANLT